MYQRILVAIDGSATSDRGLHEAIKMASLTHAKLLLVHAIDDLSFSFALQSAVAYTEDWHELLRQDGKAILSRALKAAQDAGIDAETRLSDAYVRPVHERIVAEADRWHADLIVIGTHGRRGFQRMLLGSAAESVLRIASKPVLLVRGADGDAAQEDSSQHADAAVAQ